MILIKKALSAEEQIVDYYARAILLPLKYMKQEMDKANYDNLNEKSQMRFIRSIAKKRKISEDIVYERILDVKKIYN